MMSSLKGDQRVFFKKTIKRNILPRLLQSQSETKYNVLNFSMNDYLEYVAKLNALPVKEKFGENRR